MAMSSSIPAIVEQIFGDSRKGVEYQTALGVGEALQPDTSATTPFKTTNAEQKILDELRHSRYGTALCGPRLNTATPDRRPLPTRFAGSRQAFPLAGPAPTPPGAGWP